MSLGSHKAQADSVIALLDPLSAAATANATGAWIATPLMAQGDLEITVQVGAVTGQIVPAIEDATDGSGTGVAAVVPTEGAFTTVTTSNDPLTQKRTIPVKSLRAYFRFIGTITTGPVLVGASATYHPKDTSARVIN